MKLKDFTKEMVDEHSFIEMAYIYLSENSKETNLYDMVDEFKRIGNYKDSEIENRILQFYTDLNTDGRFLSVGENIWGLRDWYSVEDIEEKIAPTIQKFNVLDEDDEEDTGITLLGEEDKTKDVDITIAYILIFSTFFPNIQYFFIALMIKSEFLAKKHTYHAYTLNNGYFLNFSHFYDTINI